MKPKDNYKDVLVPKVWEAIPEPSIDETSEMQVYHHHLVTKEVSDYIRLLEQKVEELSQSQTPSI